MEGYIAQTIWLSVRAAAISTLISTPLAVIIGYFLARRKFFLKPLVEAIISFPLAAPPVITGYLLLLLFGRNGLIGAFLFDNLGIKLSFNFAALVLAASAVSLPLAVRGMKTSFSLIDPSYAKAAQSLGAAPLSAFFRVSLPMALHGVLSAAVLAFVRSLGEFGATITLAGNIPGKTQTLSLMVYSNMQIPGKEAEVIKLVIFSALVSLTAMGISEFLNRKGEYMKG